MHEDLASMGGSISDEDFTSIVLGSIPLPYDTYIAAITAMSTLLNQTLSPMNLIDSICDKADCHTIKNPKSKKDKQDAAFTAGQSSEKGKKGGKKSKKGIECYNCHKKGHIAKDCWSPSGGAEGKGSKEKDKDKGKGKEKEVAANVDEKGSHHDDDSDAVWMVSIGDGNNDVTQWLSDCGGRNDVAKYELWMEDEITADGANNMEANESVDSFSVDELLVEDLGDEPMGIFMAATLTNPSILSSSETELYDSGASQHMSPYKHKFFNYVPIQTKVLTAANGGTFDATGKGYMHISMPNRQSTTRILLKDVLYAPKIGITLILISQIDAAGFTSLFYQGFLKIFLFIDGKKCLAEVAVWNGLYCVEHEARDVVAAVECTLPSPIDSRWSPWSPPGFQ